MTQWWKVFVRHISEGNNTYNNIFVLHWTDLTAAGTLNIKVLWAKRDQVRKHDALFNFFQLKSCMHRNQWALTAELFCSRLSEQPAVRCHRWVRQVRCTHLVVPQAPLLSARKPLRSDHLVSVHVRQHRGALHETNYPPRTLHYYSHLHQIY